MTSIILGYEKILWQDCEDCEPLFERGYYEEGWGEWPVTNDMDIDEIQSFRPNCVISCVPDKWDIADGIDAVYKVCDLIEKYGCNFQVDDTFFQSEYQTIDYSKAVDRCMIVSLEDGWTDEQVQEIHDELELRKLARQVTTETLDYWHSVKAIV